MSTDFQIAPTETPTAPSPAPAPTATPTPPAPTAGGKSVAHTPGGLPAIPLAVIASNSTVAGLSAVAVAAGPVAAAATAGTFLLSAVAMKAGGSRGARKTPRRTPQNPARKTPTNTRTPSGGGTRRLTPPAQRTNGGTSGGGRRTTGNASTGGRTTTTNRRTPTTNTGGTSGRGGSALRTNTPTGPKHSGPKKTGPGTKTSGTDTRNKPASRTQQIKNLRKDKATTAPTRKDRRTQDLANRRDLRDTARLNKRADRAAKKNSPASPTHKTGPTTSPTVWKKQPAGTGNTTPKTSRKATETLRPTTTDRARTKLRAVRDQANETRAERIQRARNNAKARAKQAKKTTAARTRFGLTAAGHSLLAAPLGLLGCLTTPLGKKLGWSWLQYPGRRLYRRLTATARYRRDVRIAAAAAAYTTDTQTPTPNPTDPNQNPTPLADTVARAPRTGHAPDLGDTDDMSEDIKLHFLETSEETVSAARAYEPGGMLHVRQVIKAMPVALENWAQAFAVLAEKSDAEFPLGDEIGEGLDDIHQQMRALIGHAEELAQTFDRLHEADIERLISPRKSREAEKLWDSGANEDYDGE